MECVYLHYLFLLSSLSLHTAKDLARENYSQLEPRSKRVSRHLDSGSFLFKVDDESHIDSASSSPTPATIQSPLFHADSLALDSTELDIVKESVSGPHRGKASSPASSAKMEKEKRKRSRVTPEQLVHLERLFSVDRSPTAGRRKEISELLGMQERQTQIWFQNR
jgi:regulatory protein PHO2